MKIVKIVAPAAVFGLVPVPPMMRDAGAGRHRPTPVEGTLEPCPKAKLPGALATAALLGIALIAATGLLVCASDMHAIGQAFAARYSRAAPGVAGD